MFPILATPADTYSVNSNLSLRSAYYCIFADIECRENLRTHLAITVSDEKKDSLIRIVKGEGALEGFALGETLYRTIVRSLQNLDRDRLKKSAVEFRP
ncbi:MAG: hypothetical protein DME22_14750 [Verrucomicrobia bacterium]|nr:MAG: hypothetical protein DME22_14750 [Verrucomicrobiota bacterium]PYJ96067.1 MAG: hypothetical protein DME23_21820 [Verrucomicrobiota bacterium]